MLFELLKLVRLKLAAKLFATVVDALLFPVLVFDEDVVVGVLVAFEDKSDAYGKVSEEGSINCCKKNCICNCSIFCMDKFDVEFKRFVAEFKLEEEDGVFKIPEVPEKFLEIAAVVFVESEDELIEGNIDAANDCIN